MSLVSNTASAAALERDPNQHVQPITFNRNIVHRYSVKGTYAATGGADSRYIEKSFEIVGLELDDETAKQHGLLSTFLKVIAPELMPELFPDFYRVLTHRMVNASSWKRDQSTGELVKLEFPTIVNMMDRDQALRFIDENNMPIKPHLYEEIGALHQAITDCKEDVNAFLKQQAIFEKRYLRGPNKDKVRGMNNVASLLELNRARLGQGTAMLNAANPVNETSMAATVPAVTLPGLPGL